ncbi:MAG: hypothetical protein QM813_05190 [Verrucomicrobiota bacterium]
MMDDFRFYTGTGDDSFIETIRQASTPVAVTGLYPNGLSLMQGTNSLNFTVNSAAGINTSGIKVVVNGTDVSGSLVIGGTANNRTVSYTGLPVDPTLVANANLNAVTLGLQVTDTAGYSATNVVIYDAFNTANFTWEAEDYDYADDVFAGPANLFIDNPRYAFETAVDTYWQRQGMPPVDYADNATAAQNAVFRGPFDLVATEFAVSTGAEWRPIRWRADAEENSRCLSVGFAHPGCERRQLR